MTEREQKIYSALQAAFADAEIEVIDYAGDQDHFMLKVKAKEFEGAGTMQKHKLMHKALGSLMQEVHAFQFELTS